MKVIEGGFGKKAKKEPETIRLNPKEVFERLASEETLEDFDSAFGFAMREDGLSVFATNLTVHEVYIQLDILKDYLRNQYDEF